MDRCCKLPLSLNTPRGEVTNVVGSNHRRSANKNRGSPGAMVFTQVVLNWKDMGTSSDISRYVSMKTLLGHQGKAENIFG
jgi:hypothetical protein